MLSDLSHCNLGFLDYSPLQSLRPLGQGGRKYMISLWTGVCSELFTSATIVGSELCKPIQVLLDSAFLSFTLQTRVLGLDPLQVPAHSLRDPRTYRHLTIGAWRAISDSEAIVELYGINSPLGPLAPLNMG